MELPPYAPPPMPPRRSAVPWVLGGLAGCLGCGFLLFVLPTLLGFGLLAGAMKWGLESAAQAQREIHVMDHRMTSEGGKRFITGAVRNLSKNRAYNSVGVDLLLYDKAGRELPYASAETHDLKPGATWRFRAPVRDRKAVRYVLGTLRYGIGGMTGSVGYHTSRFNKPEAAGKETGAAPSKRGGG